MKAFFTLLCVLGRTASLETDPGLQHTRAPTGSVRRLDATPPLFTNPEAFSLMAISQSQIDAGWSTLQINTFYRYLQTVSKFAKPLGSLLQWDSRLHGSLYIGFLASEMRAFSLFTADLLSQLYLDTQGSSTCGVFDAALISAEDWSLLYSHMGTYQGTGDVPYVPIIVHSDAVDNIGVEWEKFDARLEYEDSDNKIPKCVAVFHPIMYACPVVGASVCAQSKRVDLDDVVSSTPLSCAQVSQWPPAPKASPDHAKGTNYLTQLASISTRLLGELGLMNVVRAECIHDRHKP